jgi:tRNA-splicing ligase RtcB
MIPLDQIKRVGESLWEIPASARPDMRVPARFYAPEEMLHALRQDRSLDQLVNVATLPGIQGMALAMPDIHEGYGFPIGGVAATSHPDGLISPGGIGYDINCGVRMLASKAAFQDVKPRLEELCKAMFREIPSGTGKGGFLDLGMRELDRVLTRGARWAVENGYGEESELEWIESGGCLEDADPTCVSNQAKQRGHDQLGTLGSGNHFAEVDRVDRIYDAEAASAFGLSEGQVTVLIHTGSRGLGHQVATDHLRIMVGAMKGYGVHLVDRQLAGVPFQSPEGQRYFKAMAAAANFAWCNRQVIAHEARKAWSMVLGPSAGPLRTLYDVAHNIAKIETHEVGGKDGEVRRLIVHRKGATRAFGPGHRELPSAYRTVGQPVLIPGSMGTASYVLAGSEGSRASFGSSCHGAGRRLSRKASREQVQAEALRRELLARGIHVLAGSKAGLSEEAPAAYKDIDRVVETVESAGLARRVARLVPMAVIKG